MRKYILGFLQPSSYSKSEMWKKFYKSSSLFFNFSEIDYSYRDGSKSSAGVGKLRMSQSKFVNCHRVCFTLRSHRHPVSVRSEQYKYNFPLPPQCLLEKYIFHISSFFYNKSRLVYSMNSIIQIFVCSVNVSLERVEIQFQ